MNLIEKIFEKFNLSFVWKDNQKKVIKQTGSGLQVHQEQGGVTNVFHVQNLNIAQIKEFTGSDTTQDSAGLLKAAGQRFLSEQAVKQENLQTVVEKADLSAIESPQPVEKDWFLKWMEISQTVSRENVQEMLARVLSGEVRTSGSFSLRTLDTLKNLSRTELTLFQIFCDLSYSIPQFGDAFTCLICEPYGSPGDNGLLSLRLSYSNLAILQDAGLIQTDLTAWREFQIPEMLRIPFSLGSASITLKSTAETTPIKARVKIINFTSAGLELRSVLNLRINVEYNSKFLEWVNNQWKMIPA